MNSTNKKLECSSTHKPHHHDDNIRYSDKHNVIHRLHHSGSHDEHKGHYDYTHKSSDHNQHHNDNDVNKGEETTNSDSDKPPELPSGYHIRATQQTYLTVHINV